MMTLHLKIKEMQSRLAELWHLTFSIAERVTELTTNVQHIIERLPGPEHKALHLDVPSDVE